MELQIGSTVGDYQVVSVLGAGGMGQVYKVRNVISDRFEAMKVLLPDLAHAPELADRFMREIKVHASLEHPNIAGLRTALRVENQLLMVMELVEGVTLQQKLQQGPLAPATAADYMMQVLAALDYAHGRGVVHRDVKPANMMLTPAGVVKLLDFGIAKATTDHALTMTGTTLGSLYYMSPEQIQGTATLDGRTDLYSAGVSLYELVTGKRPFDGDSQFSIMSAHLEKPPVPPVQVDPRVPQALSDVILMSVARQPEARFQTAAAFRNALGTVAAGMVPAGRPAAAAPATTPAPATPVAAAPAARTRRGLWMGLGAVAMAAAAIAVIQFGPWRGTSAAPTGAKVQPAAIVTPQTPAPPNVSGTPAPAAQTAPTPSPSGTLKPTGLPALPSRPAIETPRAPRRLPAATAQREITAPVSTTPGTAAPAAPQTAPQTAPPPVPAATQPAPPPQRPPSASRAELQETREQIVQLGARANGIHASLQTLQRAQAANGLNLRGDMAEAASLMDSYLQGANAALNAGDVASAKSFLDKAEPQVERLEKFLNR